MKSANGDDSAGSKESAGTRLMTAAISIRQLTVDCVSRLCCCCFSSDPTSRQFLWMIFRQNAALTSGYFLLYLAFGMCIGFMGPTLEDLACFTEETVSKVSWAFFAQTCCMVIGIFLGGLLSRWLSPDFLLLVSVACLPLTLFILSFSRRLDVLSVTMAIMGLAMGIIDCISNLQLVNLYDKAVAPFLQAMHFCYGIGALISPLIAEHFLLNEDCSQLVMNKTMLTTQSTRADDEKPQSHVGDTLDNATKETKVYQAFWVIAAIQVPIVVYMAIVIVKAGLRVKTVKPEFKRLLNSESRPILHELKGKEKAKAEKGHLLSQWQQYLDEFQGSYSISFSKALLLTIAACLMVFIYDGLQGHVNEYTQTYAVKIIKDKKKQDGIGFLNVSFWGAYSLGRLISVILAMKLTPYFMLLINIVGCQAAVFVFLSGVGGQSLSTMYAANIMLGLFMSSITPTTITMAEHFMDMTNLQMSLIIGGAALGEMCIPIIEGQLIDLEPTTFVTLLLVLVGFSWLVYAMFWLMGRVTRKYKAMASPSFIWYSPKKVDSLSEDDSAMESYNSSGIHFDAESLEDSTNIHGDCSDEKIDTSEKEAD